MKNVKIHRYSIPLLFFTLSLLLCATVRAQSGGVTSPPNPSPTDISTVSAASTTPASAQSATTSSATGAAGSSGSNPASAQSGGVVRPGSAPPKNPVVPVRAAPQAGSQQPIDSVPIEQTPPDSSGNYFLWPILAVLALVPLGFLAANMLKKKPRAKEESDRRCFDIKGLLDEKLQELTDVRSLAQDKLTNVAKDRLREAVEGTTAGDALVRLEKLESEYNRLKQLYEECTIDIERYKYKGVLIENSLFDKKILEKLKVVQTRLAGSWTLHDIRLGSSQIGEVQKHMSEGPWYFHLWEPGKNDVTVVFKDKLFTIHYSDKTSWADAIAFGKSIGIPESQLDFRME